MTQAVPPDVAPQEAPPERVAFKRGNDVYLVNADEAALMRPDAGWTRATDADVAAAQRRAEFANNPLLMPIAAVQGALDPFGFSALARGAAQVVGGDEAAAATANALDTIRETHGNAYMGGQIGGIFLPGAAAKAARAAAEGGLIARGGAAALSGLAAPAAATSAIGEAASAAAARAVGATLGEGATGLAARLAQRAIPGAVGGAVEAGIYGAGQAASDLAVKNEPLTAEALAASAGHAALLGAGIGGGIGALSAVGRASADRVAGLLRRETATAERSAVAAEATTAAEREAVRDATETTTRKVVEEPVPGVADAAAHADVGKVADDAIAALKSIAGEAGAGAKQALHDAGSDVLGQAREFLLNPEGIANDQAIRSLTGNYITGARQIARAEAQTPGFMKELAEWTRETLPRRAGKRRLAEVGDELKLATAKEASQEAGAAVGSSLEAIDAAKTGIRPDLQRILEDAEAGELGRLRRTPGAESIVREADEYLGKLTAGARYQEATASLAAKRAEAMAAFETRVAEVNAAFETRTAELTSAAEAGAGVTPAAEREVAAMTRDRAKALRDAERLRDKTIRTAEKSLQREFPRGTNIPAEYGFRDIHSTRRFLDSEVLRYGKIGDSARADVFSDIRNSIERELIRSGDEAAAKLGEKFKDGYVKAKREFRLARTAEEVLENKVLYGRKNNEVSITDPLWSVLGSSFLGPVGAGLGFVANQVRRRAGNEIAADVFGKLAKTPGYDVAANRLVTKVQTGIDRFFTGAERAASAPRQASQAARAVRRTVEETTTRTTRERDYQRTVSSVRAAASNERATAERIEQSLAPVAQASPQVARQTVSTVLRGVAFLNAKIPVGAMRADTLTPHLDEPRASQDEKARFMRYARAVNDPVTVVEDLRAGKITREGVEAVREVYPQLYAQIQQAAVSRLADLKRPISYAQRVQLSILLGVPGDPSLQPQALSALQATYGMGGQSGGMSSPPASGQMAPAGGAPGPQLRQMLKLSQATQTATQALEAE